MTGIVTSTDSLRRAQELLRSGLEMAALEHFSIAHEQAPEDPVVRSHYGWAVAMIEHRVERGVSLCRAALRDAADQPEVYHNLARILLAHGRKAEAIKFIRRGLMVDPRNAGLVLEWRRLGIRRPPVLSFLPRRHPANRLLGRVRGRFVRDFVGARELAEATS
jgi:tetratricopeptide (TPR) repeat protein